MTDFERQCYEKYPVYLQGLNPETSSMIHLQASSAVKDGTRTLMRSSSQWKT